MNKICKRPEADCAANGQVEMYAWYELYPAGSRTLRLRVSPGDHMYASVHVQGTHVTMRIDNRTTSHSVTRRFEVRSPAVTSAEWIAEAPAEPFRKHDQVQPLTNFGQVSFTEARAVTTSGRAGTITDPAWNAKRQELETWLAPNGGSVDTYLAIAAGAHIVPGVLSKDGTSFVAHYRHRVKAAAEPKHAYIA